MYYFYSFYLDHGKRIIIQTEDASGIEVEKTKIRYRGVKIGSVKGIEFSEDKKDVLVHAILDEGYESFAVDGSRFSLVKPEVSFQGVQGLGTLLEGQYIMILPGPKGSKITNKFKLLSPGATDLLDGTSTYFLKVENAESISTGDSISFRGVKVGRVTKLSFGKESGSILVKINIDNENSYLIRENTVFWPKVGVSAKLGLFNTDIKINSLESVINGGIEFATPTKTKPMAKNFSEFEMVSDPPKDYNTWKPELR